MADIHPMLHGEEVLADSSLVDSLCPVCDQRRDWDLVRNTADEFVKKCKVCGNQISLRKASVKPAVETPPKLVETLSAKGKKFVDSVKNIFQSPGTKK